MTKEDMSITYENNIFYCTKNNIKWISVDGEKWYVEEKRIAELEKENAELKERLELLNLNANIAVRDLTNLLTKAKELLKHFIDMDLFQIAENDQDYNAIEQANQFIKEVEK